MRIPTEKQYRVLRNLGGGAAGLSWRKRETEPFLRRGWVTAEQRDGYYQWVRITSEGLRALADAVERYGLPEIGPKPQTHQYYCAKCGGTRILTRTVDVKTPLPEKFDEGTAEALAASKGAKA